MLSVISVEHNQSKLNKCFDGNIPSEAQHVFDSTQVFTSGIGYCYICQTQHAATSEVDILLLGNTSVGYRVPDDDAMRKLIETLNPAILFHLRVCSRYGRPLEKQKIIQEGRAVNSTIHYCTVM